MGKIRIKTLGDNEVEEKQKKELKNKREQKKLVKGGKGGERIVSVGPSEEELKAVIVSEANQSQTKMTSPSQALRKDKKSKQRKTKKSPHSKNYITSVKVLDKSKKYSLSEALELLEKLKRANFDETVELHVNTLETGVSGNTTLPHGTGKNIRVAIADDEILANVAKGKIEFDILLSSPDMMPKLAKVAKILGPKGLMPNPKNATLVKDPEKAKDAFKKGQLYFKTEAKAPIIHLTVGKMSYGAKKLSENINTLIEAIKKEKIRNVTLKSTMSPGIKINL